MRVEDIPQILEIERVSFPTPWTEYMFRHQLSLEDIAINLVFIEGNTIIGYAVAWIVYDEIHLLSIAVLPGKRGRGYAVKILEEVVEKGREMGGCRVVLEVRISNVGARKFYEKCRFKVVGKRKRYYHETGEDALVMELMIGG
jgi:ribosomal-protein-alanine N-acetyltransferase